MDYNHPLLNKFKPIRLLGRGGFGEVHEVIGADVGSCAAKLIKLPVQLGEEAEPISQEVSKIIESEKNLCRLSHPNIVKFILFEQITASTFLIVMELLDGKGLAVFIDKKPLAESAIINFARQICSALEYLHGPEIAVIHRDLNCSNVIVLRDGKTVKLIDFGLSLTLMEATHCTASSVQPKGTMYFMAPELFGSEHEGKVIYSKESDIWAFGCTVYQMATGSVPHGDSGGKIWKIALTIESLGAPLLPDECSGLLKDFYRHCTAMSRKHRMTAAELLQHEFLLNDSQAVGTQDISPEGGVQETVPDGSVQQRKRRLALNFRRISESAP